MPDRIIRVTDQTRYVIVVRFETVRFLVGDAQAMTLPESVIFVRDGESYVMLVGPDQTARRQRVQTGLRQQGLVQVLGLPADARVVSTGTGFVKDGERVHVSSQPVQGASS